MAAMVVAGRRYFAIGPEVPLVSFTVALLLSTLSMMSMGFIVASLVPTARFAQPIGAIIFYPMIGLCGLFVPIASFPPAMRASHGGCRSAVRPRCCRGSGPATRGARTRET